MLDIYHLLTGTQPAPSLSMTFNNKYLTGTYKIIDLSWYEPYKKTGDFVITIFVYMCFIWHCFTHASSIINGMDSGIYNSGNIVVDDMTGGAEKHSFYMRRH